MQTEQLITLVAIGLMIYQANRKATALDFPPGIAMGWQTPSQGRKYEIWFQDASQRFGLPPGLLSRMAYQESRYNPNAVSPAGAIGLMQIIPKWHPRVNPRDPKASIYYAAEYLRDLRQRTGSWILALAAYNWGIGNLQRKGIERAPRETQNYIAEISRDIQLG